MTDKIKQEAMLKHFKPHEDFKLEDYYGVTMMTIKKDRSFSLQLQYGYKRRAQNSNSLIIKDSIKALEAYRILLKFAVPLPIENAPELDFL